MQTDADGEPSDMQLFQTQKIEIMTLEEQRERVVQSIADLLRNCQFTYEYKVKAKPKGIKVIIEVTPEQLTEIMQRSLEKK